MNVKSNGRCGTGRRFRTHRGVEGHNGSLLGEELDPNVAHGGPGQRQLVGVVERVGQSEAGGASVENGHRRSVELNLGDPERIFRFNIDFDLASSV